MRPFAAVFPLLVASLLVSPTLVSAGQTQNKDAMQGMQKSTHSPQQPSATKKQDDGMQTMPGMDDDKMKAMQMGGNGLITMHPETFIQEIAHHGTSGTSAEPNSTPVPMLNCVTMLEKLVAELICDFGMSAKAIVLRLVNCIERHKPFTNSTARITIRGVSGVSAAQPSIRSAVRIPLTISTLRNPKRLRTGVVTVFIPRLPAKRPSIRRPD